MSTQGLKALSVYAQTKGYNASILNGKVIIKDVTNPGNDLSIQKADEHYIVITERVSSLDYEYTAKCTVYLLLAEFNKANSDAKHLHINFRVDL